MGKIIATQICVFVLLCAGLFITNSRISALKDEVNAARNRDIGSVLSALNTLKEDVSTIKLSRNRPHSLSQANGIDDAIIDNDKLINLENEVAAIWDLIENTLLLQETPKTFESNRNTESNETANALGFDNGVDEEMDEAALIAKAAGIADGDGVTEKEKLDQRFSMLDGIMAGEEINPEWSVGMVTKIDEIIDQISIEKEAGIQVNSFDCQAEICRVETVAPGYEQSHIIEEALIVNLPPGESAQVITRREDLEDGSVATTFYILKDQINHR